MPPKTAERGRALALMRSSPELSDREIARRVGVGNKTVSRWRREDGRGTRAPVTRDGLSGEALMDALPAAGVSRSQVTRWRQAGLLPPPERRWYGGGSRSAYPRSVIAQARDAGALMARYGSVNDAALGLLVYGWPIRDDRVRRAYGAWLEPRQHQFQQLQRAMDVGAASDERGDEMAQALLDLFRSGRSFRVARRVVRLRRSDDQAESEPVGVAVWEYLTEVLGISLHGTVGSDDDVARLLSTFGPALEPLDKQIDVARMLYSATTIDELKRTARDTPLEQLRTTCKEVTLLYIFYLVLIDCGVAISDVPASQRPPALSSVFGDQPVMIARFALALATVKRHPDLGPPVRRWLNEFTPATLEELRSLFAELRAIPPQLEALIRRYLVDRARAPED